MNQTPRHLINGAAFQDRTLLTKDKRQAQRAMRKQRNYHVCKNKNNNDNKNKT
jgi:hypothetical protein